MGEGINGAKGLKTMIAASLRRCARYIGAMEEGINGAKGLKTKIAASLRRCARQIGAMIGDLRVRRAKGWY